MASPFSVFRKNQKFLMAVACLLAIIAFVFLPILMQYGGDRAGGDANKVVVKTSKLGELRESDIQDMVMVQRKVLGVLTDLRIMAGEYASLAEQRSKMEFGAADEESVVNQWLLTNYAQQLGMVVGDEAINAFLRLWTRNVVKAPEIVAVFKRSGLSELQFFDLMGKELVARQVRQMFYATLECVTPAQRWEYFNRIQQAATIEAIPVDVAGFVKKVEDPNDEELKAFFEANKDRYARPDSSEPGFHEPQRVALQWFKAKEDQFMASVTDAEIKTRYEKNKKLYDDAEKKAAELRKEMESKAKSKSGDKATTKEAKAAKDAVKSEQKQLPAANSPAETKKNVEAEKKDVKKEEKKSSPGASVDRSSPFQLVSYMLEEEKADKTNLPAADAKKPTNEVNGMAEATRKRIRREIADENMFKAFGVLQDKMKQYHNEWSRYEVSIIQQKGLKGDAKKPLPAEPVRPDLAKLAKENGLSTGEVPLMSQWDFASLEIGRSLVNGRSPVAGCAFQSMAKFRPELAMDPSQGDFYLFWKIGETKDRVPKFSDEGVRERVLQEWKMIRARKLAMEQADVLAAEANKSKKTLKELFGGKENMHVLTPSPFSWMTFGNVPLGSAPGAARISEVMGVEYPGDEFMEMVFQLEPGKSGAALNAPKTVAYVVRLRDFKPSREVRWKEFEVDDFSKYAPAAAPDQRQLLKAWVDSIQFMFGMKWERKPNQSSDGGERGAEE